MMGLLKVTAYYARLRIEKGMVGCFPLALTRESIILICLEKALIEESVTYTAKLEQYVRKDYEIEGHPFFLDEQCSLGYFAGTNPAHDCVPVISRREFNHRIAVEAVPFIWWDRVRRPSRWQITTHPRYVREPWIRA